MASTVVYFAAQGFAAAGWVHPGYSWSTDYISDLGNTACGQFAVPHDTKVFVCSPRHLEMNAAFVVTGVLVVVGALLLRRMWPATRHARTATWLFVVAGAGKMVVGLVPENTRIGLHLLGALNVPVMCVGVILASLAIRPTSPTLATVGFVLATVGLVATVLSTAGEFGGHGLYLGLGVGGMERISDYPTSLWTLLMGVVAVAQPMALRSEALIKGTA